MTTAWHVDDLKVSHKHEKAVDQFIAWLESKYGSDTGRAKAVKGNRHNYLRMILDFSKKGKVMVDMTGYVKKMLEEFPKVLKDNVTTPASNKVFDVDESPKLEAKRAELLHIFVAKALFIAKRGRPDIQVTRGIPVCKSPRTNGTRLLQAYQDDEVSEENKGRCANFISTRSVSNQMVC